MPKKIFELRHIFGLKLKELRQQKGITYQELSETSGLSVSYLSEIESGKKYPKGDKIIQLANALDISYDDLVSLKVPKKLQPVIDLIESPFFREFPLEEFGINPQKLIEIVSQDPAKTNAIIQTIMQVARNYELKEEQLYHAALRSYQEQQNNYYEDLEEAVEQIHMEFIELMEIPFSPELLEGILLKFGVRTDYRKLHTYNSLKNLRSLFHPKNRILYINSGLNKGQKNFLLAREIAFQWMQIKKRPLSTPPHGKENFESILLNHKASYFAAALLMPKKNVIPDVKDFAGLIKWNEDKFIDFINRYDATPEMIMQRLTNILPEYFNLQNLFFLRFLKKEGHFFLTKELHLNHQHNPHANELNEHYCRRWLATNIINDLEASGKSLIAKAQRSKYYDSGNDYLCLSFAFPNISNKKESISVTIGFLVDQSLNKRIRFLNDKSVDQKLVNITCERCPISDCKDRAATSYLNAQEQEEEKILADIDDILSHLE